MIRSVLAIGCMVACLFLASANTIVLAQPPTNGDTQQQIVVLKALQTSIVQTIGGQKETVEVTTSGSILTVNRVNTTMNKSTHGGRNNEAKAIAQVISKTIINKAEFKNIIAIRVQYLVREESASASNVVLDSIEFRKGPGGEFEFHVT